MGIVAAAMPLQGQQTRKCEAKSKSKNDRRRALFGPAADLV
jgi:hypothetical protein